MEKLDLEEYVIKDEFYKSIADEITCSICSSIKQNPMMCSKCQNSFCSTCCEDWKKKSKECPFKCNDPEYVFCRIVNNLLSKLNFKCKNNCGEIIPYEKLNSHYEFECKKIDLKERNKKLTNKCHELELKYNKFKNAFYSLLNFQLDSKIVEDPDDLDYTDTEIFPGIVTASDDLGGTSLTKGGVEFSTSSVAVGGGTITLKGTSVDDHSTIMCL